MFLLFSHSFKRFTFIFYSKPSSLWAFITKSLGNSLSSSKGPQCSLWSPGITGPLFSSDLWAPPSCLVYVVLQNPFFPLRNLHVSPQYCYPYIRRKMKVAKLADKQRHVGCHIIAPANLEAPLTWLQWGEILLSSLLQENEMKDWLFLTSTVLPQHTTDSFSSSPVTHFHPEVDLLLLTAGWELGVLYKHCCSKHWICRTYLVLSAWFMLSCELHFLSQVLGP